MRASLFPGPIDRPWLAYVARFAPLDYVLAQHICPGALDAFQGRECQVVYQVEVPGWTVQVVRGDPWDEDADDASLEDIFGDDLAGILIDYCPFCGECLPDLGVETCLDYWQGAAPVTMTAVAGALMRLADPDRNGH